MWGILQEMESIKVAIDYYDININNTNSQVQINITIDHLLLEICFWNVVNVHAQLKYKLFFNILAVNVIHTSLYCM